MAGSKADAWEAEVLRLATGQAATFTGLTCTLVPYIALFTGVFSGDTPGTECTGGGYARISSAGKWGAPATPGGTVSNNAAITFATFTGSVSAGAAITHFGIFDALTAGHALYYGDLTDPTKTYTTGDICQFNIGDLTLTEG